MIAILPFRTSTLGLLMGAALLAWAGQALAATRAEIKQLVVEEALNSDVPAALALAVAKVESDFQARALGPRGSRGVMQILPRTAQGEFGVGADELWDPRLNIQLGIDFLERLAKRYGGRWDLALSHYNGGTLAGSGAQALPHAYTKGYVERVQRWQRRYADQARLWAAAEPPDIAAPAAKTAAKAAEKTAAPAPRLPEPDVVAHAAAGLVDRPGALDDFTPAIEPRRVRYRRQLDDFAPIIVWTEG